MVTDFTEWLLGEIQRQGLSMREVARRSKGAISHSAISLVLSRKQPASAEFCVGVAKGLGLPPTEVLRRAGQIGPAPGETERLTLRELWEILRGLSDTELTEVRRYARYLRETRDAGRPQTEDR